MIADYIEIGEPLAPMIKACLDPFVISEVCAASQGGVRGQQVWAYGEGRMFTSWQPRSGGDWTQWVPHGVPANILALAASQQGEQDQRLQLFVIDDDHQLWTLYQTSPGGDWVGWEGPNWNNQKQPFRAVATASQSFPLGQHVFAIDREGCIWTCWQQKPGGGWTEWQTFSGGNLLAGARARTLAVSMQGSGTPLQLFALDELGRVYSCWQGSVGEKWTSWNINWNGAPVLDEICVSSQGEPYGQHVFGLTPEGLIKVCWQPNAKGQWTSWQDFSKQPPAGQHLLELTVSQQGELDRRLQIFGLGDNGLVWTCWQTDVGESWVDWAGPEWNGRLTA